MKKPIDIEALLDQTFFGLDTLAMLGDIEDFIDFSESNIDQQKRRELRRAERECKEVRFEDSNIAAQYYFQTIDGVAYRFEVSLTQRVRYAALTSLITTIEWVLISLKNRAAFRIPKIPKGKSEAVHYPEVFNQTVSLGLISKIQTIETLVQIRNCIVHSAGLLASYKYGTELRQSLSALQGIKVSNINFLGDAIEIEQGHLQRVVEDVKQWLPSMEKAMHEKGLLQK